MDNYIDYAGMVRRLAKPGHEIRKNIGWPECNLLHATLGIAGEAGEIVDSIKKHVIYGQDLNMNNVIEELGDMEFYMELLRQELGITREQTLKANMEKLAKRYNEGTYTDKAAKERADKLC